MILVVDDDVWVAQVLKMRLEAEGHLVSMQHTVADALEAVRLEQPDLVITDVDLTYDTGFELHSRLHEEPGFDAPVIYLSGSLNDEDQREAHRLGGAAFLGKPFRFEELLVTVKALLGAAAAGRAAELVHA